MAKNDLKKSLLDLLSETSDTGEKSEIKRKIRGTLLWSEAVGMYMDKGEDFTESLLHSLVTTFSVIALEMDTKEAIKLADTVSKNEYKLIDDAIDGIRKNSSKGGFVANAVVMAVFKYVEEE